MDQTKEEEEIVQEEEEEEMVREEEVKVQNEPNIVPCITFIQLPPTFIEPQNQ